MNCCKVTQNEKMKLVKPLLFLVTIILLSACGAGGSLPTPTTSASTALSLTVTPSITPQPTETLIPIPTPILPLPTDQVEPAPPAWVTDFSDPILAAVNYRFPDVHDEFSPLNKGWFYIIPGSRKNPYYAHQVNGSLLVQLPAENEKKDAWVYNPRLIRKNFVLNFDFQFEATQPDDMVRFQFDQSKDQSVALDFFKNKTWTLHWGSRADWQSITGTFDYLPPERLDIVIIMLGEKCAIYLNENPLTYVSNCRSKAITRSSPQAVTFHLLAEPGHNAGMTIDNVKLWDLDKIKGLP